MDTSYTITINGVSLSSPAVPRQNELFTGAALDFLAELHREFAPRMEALGFGGKPAGAPADWQALVGRYLAQPQSGFISPRRLLRTENKILCDGSPMSAGIVDFGLHLHRCARRLLNEGRAPFVSLPTIETEEELQLWQDLFTRAEQLMGLPDGTIRAIHLGPGEPDMDDDEDGQASSAAVLMTRNSASSETGARTAPAVHVQAA